MLNDHAINDPAEIPCLDNEKEAGQEPKRNRSRNCIAGPGFLISQPVEQGIRSCVLFSFPHMCNAIREGLLQATITA